jgi:maltose alpha-D-glucosyltransferase/alpha-amylase
MTDDYWYRNAIIYSLDVETFMDANGDGVGDFEGLTERLDYLDALGVDTLWLAPFQPTPNRDNGYDISDYYGVDPRHGSSGDFVEFLHEANRRGMKVMMDLVVNHTSNRHPWFESARRDPESKYRSWYFWSKKRPPGWNKGMVFPGVQKAVWSKDDVAGEYYFHRFYDFQPDLNFGNPQVRAEIRRVIGYWLNHGIAGFRIDALPFILEMPNTPHHEQQRLEFSYLTELRRCAQWRRGDVLLLGEANVPPNEDDRYFGEHDDGVQMIFNFFVNQHLFHALATGAVGELKSALRQTSRIPKMAQWAHFLRNHDELDLGRLTQEERQCVFDAFGPEPRMRLYDRGIRRRLASMLGDRRRIELAYSVMFALPGTPVLRYGDEIGMGDDLALKERAAVRTPMQWADAENGGFSSASKLVHPAIGKGPYGYPRVNVESQWRDPGSLLNWTVQMIRLRKRCPEIGRGDWSIVPVRSEAVLVLTYRWRGTRLVTVHNFSDMPRTVRFRIAEADRSPLVDLIVDRCVECDADGRYELVLGAYGYQWLRIGGLGPAPRSPPSAVDQQA